MFQAIARKLAEQQSYFDSQRLQNEKEEQELKAKLLAESAKVVELQMKLRELNDLTNADYPGLVGYLHETIEVSKNNLNFVRIICLFNIPNI